MTDETETETATKPYDQIEFMQGVNDLAARYARLVDYHPNPILSDLCANLLALAMVAYEAEDLYPQIMAKAQKQAEQLLRQREIDRKLAILRSSTPEGRA